MGMMTDDKFLEGGEVSCDGGMWRGQVVYPGGVPGRLRKRSKIKEGKLIILYSSNPVQQDSYPRQAQGEGFVVVKLDDRPLDAAFINQMEMEVVGCAFHAGGFGYRGQSDR